jgi:hypothetical protein
MMIVYIFVVATAIAISSEFAFDAIYSPERPAALAPYDGVNHNQSLVATWLFTLGSV